nr:S-layer homology domain-containing protein [uncultured Oscillibacter sp.]
MKKRLLAVFLTAAMLLSVLPASALAAEGDGDNSGLVYEDSTDPVADPVEDTEDDPTDIPGELDEGPVEGEGDTTVTDQEPEEPVEEPTAEEQLAELIAALPDPAKIDPLDEEQMEAVYNQISAIYAFAEANGLGDRDNGLLDEAANATVNAVIAAMNSVQTLTEPDTTITIEEDTIWNDATPLSENLTVNSGVTLTIGAQVTISGDVTISGGGTIKRADSYTGDIEEYTQDSTDADGNLLQNAPEAAHLFYVPADNSLTLTNITIDGNAGWELSETAPEIGNKDSTPDTYKAEGYTAVIGAMIRNEGTLTLNTGATLQNNFNFYQTDKSGTSLGGAVYNAGEMTVNTGAVIQYNSSRYGGAIRNENGSKLTIAGGDIQYNNGSAGAAGIMANADMEFMMTGGSIKGNGSPVTAGWSVGSGIFLGNGVVANLTGGSITGNKGYSGGAGIYITAAAGKVNIGAVTISDNEALNSVTPNLNMGLGGAIYSLASGVTVSGATISGNTGNRGGGGIAVGGSGKMTITGNTTISNNTGGYGGGVYVMENAVCTIEGNTKITDNKIADTTWSQWASGGGIYVMTNATLNISGSVTISNNTAIGTTYTNRNGGGISSDGTVNINGTDVKISHNTGYGGGGIRGNSGSNTTVTGKVTISNNKATAAHGGGADFVAGSSASLTGSEVLFTGNTASANQGGGIHFNGTGANTLTLDGITVSGGELAEGFSNAKLGGGIAIEAAATPVTIKNVTVSGNSALENGGGIWINAGSVNITGCTISGNTAAASGGGIYTYISTITCEIQNTEISGNTASSTTSYLGGGGIYVGNATTMILEDCTISNNTAAASGGGIQSRSALIIKNTDVQGNTATNYGGGIDLYAGTLSISGSPVIIGNTVSNAENNVYLRVYTKDSISTQLVITLADKLTSGAAIGVTTQTAVIDGSPVPITTAETDTDTTYYKDAAQYFVADAKPTSGGTYLAEVDSEKQYVKLSYTNETYYKVTLELENITCVGGTVTQIKENETYSGAIQASTGYSLPASIESLENGVTYTKNGNFASISMTVTEDTTIKVVGVANTYTVAFNANGGSGDMMQSQTMTYDVAQELTANTYSKANYNFAGWATSADGTCEHPDKESVKNLATDNGVTVILYAVWTAKEVINKFDDTNAAQSYTYDGSQKTYKLTSDIEDFKITYKQGETEVEKPTDVGTYDVVISRDEDDIYAAFTQTIAAGLVITAADYPVSITANGETSLAITGSGTVTLTVTTTVEGITVSGVTCSDESISAVKNGDGTYSATLPNSTKTYTFTATVEGDTSNYGDGPATCTVSVTRYTSGGGGGSSSSTTYTVTVDSTKNGTVTVSPKNASKNTTVTITVKANDGYELSSLTVTDKNGDTVNLTRKSDTQYTFTMPASKVTVAASFTKIVEQPSVTFADVLTSAYYYDAVAWAVENGITYGTSATTFSPDLACTRAQAVTFLWRAAGSPAPKSSVNPFADVSASAYYYDAVLWAVEQGITVGTSATTFSPDTTCTRGQIVTFLYRAEGTATTGSNPFTDVSNSAYYVDAVKWAVAESVTAGTSATTFSPNASCTRAQIVTFLYRAYA